MKENVKGTIRAHLNGTNGALSIEHLMEVVPKTTPRSTVGRALRALWAANQVVSNIIPGDPKRRKMWSAIGQPQTLISPVPGVVQVTTTGRTQSSQPNVSNTPKPLSKDTNTLDDKEVFVDIPQAVEAVIKRFMTQKNAFSAHDVTKTLRKEVNSGRAKVDSVSATCHVDGEAVQKIEHDEVRREVHRFYEAGNMPDYDRVDNGTFQEFKPKAAQAPAPASSPYDGSSTL